MKITSLITLALVTGMLLLSYSAPSHSASFFKCKPSYKFETNGNNSARCFRAESRKYTAPNKCPNVFIPIINKSIGHFLKVDYQGSSDKCVGTFKVGSFTNSNAIDLVCQQRYNKLEVKKGADSCYKIREAKSVSPSERVIR